MSETRQDTYDRRRQAAKASQAENAQKRIRRAISRLLASDDFRVYIAHLVYGRLGMKRDPWRPNAGDTAKTAARYGVGVEILQELREIDPQGYIALEQHHVNRQAEELELQPVMPQGDADNDD